MKVFISWSGEPSRTVAISLRDWLPQVLQYVKPWMSEQDVGPGVPWGQRLLAELASTSFGIICLTSENQDSPWMSFESGALAKVVDESRVVPLRINLEPVEVVGPLSLFQSLAADKGGIRALVESLNGKMGEQALESEKLHKAFQKWWPDLSAILNVLPTPAGPPVQARSVEDMIGEVLELVRGLSRQGAENEAGEFLRIALDHIAAEGNLSATERQILGLQLLGASYKDMADELSLSVDTVKKHFSQIHRKTGTRGSMELLGKYFRRGDG